MSIQIDCKVKGIDRIEKMINEKAKDLPKKIADILKNIEDSGREN